MNGTMLEILGVALMLWSALARTRARRRHADRLR